MSSLMLWAWFALAVVPTPQTSVVSGTVVDTEGKPVKGATVWLTAFVHIDVDVEDLAQVETGAEGRFTVEAPAGSGERPRFLSIWAHAPGSQVAIASLSRRPKDDRGPIHLTLGPPAKTPVRVRGAEGKPLAGATVRLSSRVFPAGLRAKLGATTDAQGRTAIEDVNPGQVYRLDVTTDRLGTQGHNVAQDQAEKTVQLLPVGRVAVRIATDNPTARAGWTVVASSFPDEASNPRRETNSAHGRSDESGQVALGPLAEGQVAIRVERPEGVPYLPEAKMPAQATLRSGETLEVAIGVKKAIKVEGSVQEHGTGKPAAGVKVDLIVLSPGFRSQDVVTNDEGQFSLHVLPCKLRVSLTWFELPDRYFHAPDAHWADHDIAAGEETRTLAPLEVWPAVAIKGTVVDGAGKPVEGVQVVGSCHAPPFGDHTIPGSTQSDEQGAFVLGRMAPDSRVEVRGLILNRAETQRVTVRLDAGGVQDAPVTLRLARRPSVRLRGRVIGPGGRPVAGALVRIEFRSKDGQNVYGNSQDERTVTDADGLFRTPDSMPAAEAYQAIVTADGMEPGRSRWLDAPGVVLPDLVLRRVVRLRRVTGRVVDPDGKPVVGAEVFQAGDGPRRTSDTTGDDGRFAVEDVYDAPAFVFVKKDGYRFTGQKVGSGDKAVEVVATRTDGPAPAPLKEVPRPWTRAEERSWAREAIARDVEAFRPQPKVRPMEFRPPTELETTVALVEPDRMVGLVEDQIVRAEGALLLNLALGLYGKDPREAVETLDLLRPPQAAAAGLLDLFDAVPDAPADVRRDLLNRALARARAVGEPAPRVALTARVADRWFEAGEPEKGRALADEARGASGATASGASLDARGALAGALARVDLPAALDVTGPARNEERLAGVVRRAVANDPAGAERIFARLTQRQARLGVLADLCAGIAIHDVSRARSLALEAGAPGVAALTAAAAARLKAADDPAGAKTLLAEAFDRLEPLKGQIVVPSVSMARLLPLAVRVDPARSPEAFWRALAARAPRAPRVTPNAIPPATRRQYLHLAQLAATVARYDREAAEIVFAPVAEIVPVMAEDRIGLTDEGLAIFRAAAHYDPRAALALLDALPDEPAAPAVGRPRASTPRTRERARLAVARSLALPPALGRREAFQIPGQPDLWPEMLDD